MDSVFLAAFVISSTIHLYASKKCDKKLRAQTKWIILPALCGWYCAASPVVSPVVIAALLTSWLGDILLIPKGNKWFAAGGVAFGISHICFCIAYSRNIDFAAVPVWTVGLAAAVYAIASVMVFNSLRPHLPKALFYPMLAYLLANGTMNCCALCQLISKPCLGTAITFIGATQFFISDALLFFVRFDKNSGQKSHFAVMLTYILAELLIVLGLIFIG